MKRWKNLASPTLFAAVIAALLLTCPTPAPAAEAPACSLEDTREAVITACFPKFSFSQQRIYVEAIVATNDPKRAYLLLIQWMAGLTRPERTEAIKVMIANKRADRLLNTALIWDQLTVFQKRMVLETMCREGQEIGKHGWKGTPFNGCPDVWDPVKDAEGTAGGALPPPPPPKPSAGGYGAVPLQDKPPPPPEFVPPPPAPGTPLAPPVQAAPPPPEEPPPEGVTPKAGTPAASALEAAVAARDPEKLLAVLRGLKAVPASQAKGIVKTLLNGGYDTNVFALQKLGAQMSDPERRVALENYLADDGDPRELLMTTPLSAAERKLILQAATSPKQRQMLEKVKGKLFQR